MTKQFVEENTYAVKHKDNEIRMASRSGGIFTALTDYVLEQNGAVYGCVLNESFEAVHTRAVTKKERDRMRGSKYVQSQLNDTFKQVKEDLEEQRMVLFSGTSCQVAGLKAYLSRVDTKNLICVDIVCHGVPSPRVWNDYMKYREAKYGECKSVDFRNKQKFGWTEHVETLELETKTVDSKEYTTLFYGHTIIRPSCFKCPFKSTVHPGDITIADYWGINEAAPGFSDNKGVSLVLINNEHGKDLFDKVKEQTEYKKTDLSKSLQPPLIAPFPEPENREKFWKDYNSKSFAAILRKYGHNSPRSILKRGKRKIKRILR